MKNKIKDIWTDLNEELFLFIKSKIKDEEIAKDILQEVFLKIQLKLEQLNDTSKLTSWVYQITRNTIIDHYRKPSSKNTSIKDIDIPEDEKDSFEYIKLTNCIHQKINTLTTEHKQAIELAYFKEYSQKELAKYLNISYSGTKSRVQAARSVLKQKIIDCPNVESDKTGKLIDLTEKK